MISSIVERLTERIDRINRDAPLLVTHDELADIHEYMKGLDGKRYVPTRLPNGCYGLFMGREIYLKYEPLEIEQCNT